MAYEAALISVSLALSAQPDTCRNCETTDTGRLCDFIHTLFILGTDDIHTLRGVWACMRPRLAVVPYKN